MKTHEELVRDEHEKWAEHNIELIKKENQRVILELHKAELDSSGTAGQGMLKVEFKFQERGQPQTGFNSLHVDVPVALPILDPSRPLNAARDLALTLLTAGSRHICSTLGLDKGE